MFFCETHLLSKTNLENTRKKFKKRSSKRNEGYTTGTTDLRYTYHLPSLSRILPLRFLEMQHLQIAVSQMFFKASKCFLQRENTRKRKQSSKCNRTKLLHLSLVQKLYKIAPWKYPSVWKSMKNTKNCDGRKHMNRICAVVIMFRHVHPSMTWKT